jgi:hypothetical protein
MARIRRDGKAYDGGDATITALGQIWDEVTEFTYGTTMEHQKNYSIGSRKASSWSMGKIDDTSSITLMMNQAVSLERAADGDLLSIRPFDINATFADDFNEVVNDTVICKFASQGREINTEMGLAKQYDLFVLDIDYNNI